MHNQKYTLADHCVNKIRYFCSTLVPQKYLTEHLKEKL